MSCTQRVVRRSLLILGLALAACGGPKAPTPQSCSGEDGCDGTARCVQNTCMENQSPVAAFTWSGDLLASAEITLDASSSHDPDESEGDAVSSYAWSATSSDASCSGPTISTTNKIAKVRFACAGHWDVKLIVSDAKHVTSAPAVHTLAVAESTGPSVVTAGDDQTVAHACAGSPLKCTIASAIQLAATLGSDAGLTVRWTVQPPTGRELDSTRRVTFSPSETSLHPTVWIETDGTAISGDWVFRVEALSGTDVVGSDVMRVSVTNQPPTLTVQSPGTVPHTYRATDQLYLASGSFPAQVVDPDGDPVTRTFSPHHTGDGESAFQALDNGATIGFAISVPGAHPEWLIASTGLSRTVSVDAVDVNGATANQALATITVGNSPPKQYNGLWSLSHGYDATERAFVSTPILGRWSDPDGDPLDHQVTMSDANATDCPTSALLSDGAVQLSCMRKRTSGTDLQGFTASRSPSIVIRDPWTAIAPYTVTFRIGNNGPRASTSFSSTARIKQSINGGSSFCGSGGSGSPPRANLYGPGSGVANLTGLTDPDGDPIQVSQGSSTSACYAAQTCALSYIIAQWESCSTPTTWSTSFTATDGASSATFSVAITPDWY